MIKATRCKQKTVEIVPRFFVGYNSSYLVFYLNINGIISGIQMKSIGWNHLKGEFVMVLSPSLC